MVRPMAMRAQAVSRTLTALSGELPARDVPVGQGNRVREGLVGDHDTVVFFQERSNRSHHDQSFLMEIIVILTA